MLLNDNKAGAEMKRITYKCIINNELCDVKTLVVADDEADALAKVMVKFKDIEHTEQDVSISPFMGE